MKKRRAIVLDPARPVHGPLQNGRMTPTGEPDIRRPMADHVVHRLCRDKTAGKKGNVSVPDLCPAVMVESRPSMFVR